MKFKEFFPSAYHTIRLSIKSTSKLNKINKCLPIIVSLTSIPARLTKVHYVIRSILDQEEKPEKIVLWLNEKDKERVPKLLKKLESPCFEIKYSPLTCSHKKLIHSLEEFPEKIIVTCDDDFIYHPQWLKGLYKEHQKYPQAIIANRIRQIQYDTNQVLLPYQQWKVKHPGMNKNFLAIGAGGVLYPPNSLSEKVHDSNLFLNLSPKADDLWFKAMALLKGTEIKKNPDAPNWLLPIFGTQKVSLKKENIGQDKNRDQWQKLADYFQFHLE